MGSMLARISTGFGIQRMGFGHLQLCSIMRLGLKFMLLHWGMGTGVLRILHRCTPCLDQQSNDAHAWALTGTLMAYMQWDGTFFAMHDRGAPGVCKNDAGLLAYTMAACLCLISSARAASLGYVGHASTLMRFH